VAPAPPAAPTGPRIGAPEVADNLTIFPIRSTSQDDVGPLVTLESALARKTASVHETGRDGEDGEVNTLVIDNRGNVPIYVLAGTIVKGGRQDRQIGDDFIVGAHQSVPVDAYCVEHGRWEPVRDGRATGGQFGVSGVLTPTKVRTAAQYEHDQQSVWSKVAAVNAAHKKEAPSGTLMATVDSGDVAARRSALAQRVQSRLQVEPDGDQIVGVAYAVDGKVRSARWFASHKVFEMFRQTLVDSAAMEAVTAQTERTSAAVRGAPPAAPPPVAADAVDHFVADVQAGKVKEQRATPAMNVNDIRESKSGYGASTSMKAAPHAAPRPVSTSVTSF
jgi:hypothetical protein